MAVVLGRWRDITLVYFYLLEIAGVAGGHCVVTKHPSEWAFWENAEHALPVVGRASRALLHNRKGDMAPMGPGVQQLRARPEPERHHQQDHGVRVGLLRRHIPGQLHGQPGGFHDPGGVCGSSDWPQWQKGKVTLLSSLLGRVDLKCSPLRRERFRLLPLKPINSKARSQRSFVLFSLPLDGVFLKISGTEL